jgi:hypothetical protein
MATALSTSRRNALLEQLMHLRSDADHRTDVLTHFLPLPAHSRALSRDVVVVRGERGAGKSMLFKVLGELRDKPTAARALLPQAEQTSASWQEGFSESDLRHPAADLVARFVAAAPPERVRVMWMAHLVGILQTGSDPAPHPPSGFLAAWSSSRNDIDRWVSAAEAALPQLTSALDAAESAFAARGGEVVILYDHLDKIGTTAPTARAKATAGLLALWLSLSSRYRAIRAKIFVRQDLFEASLSKSADASKLASAGSPRRR